MSDRVREAAEALWRDIKPSRHYGRPDWYVNLISFAFRDQRAQALEEARDLVCDYCAKGEPVVKLGWGLGHPWEHRGKIIYSSCSAAQLRDRAKTEREGGGG